MERTGSGLMIRKRIFQEENYKIIISIIIGIIGFIASYHSVQLNYGIVKIVFNWGLIFPLLVTMAWGVRYGIISQCFGMTIFHPFYLNRYYGWVCFVSMLAYFIWIVIIGSESKRARRRFISLFIKQLKYILICILLYSAIFPVLVYNNPRFWNSEAVTSANIIFYIEIFINIIIIESLFVMIGDILLQLPLLRKLFHLKINPNSKFHSLIILGITSFGLFVCFIITYHSFILDTHQYTLKWLIHPSEKVVINFLLTSIFCLIFSGLMAELLQSFHAKLIEDYREQQKIIGMFRDVTQYKEAKEKREISEKRYKLLYNKMLNGFFVIEPILDGKSKVVDIRFIDVNPAFEEHIGKKKTDVLGKTWFEIYGYHNYNLNIYEKVLLSGQPQTFQSYYPHLNNKFFLANAFKLNENQLGVIFDNITDIMEAKKKLQLSKEKYRNIFENIQDIYYETDLEGNIELISPSVKKLLGYEPEEVIGRNGIIFYANPGSRSGLVKKLMQNGSLVNNEIQLITKEGYKKIFLVTSYLIKSISDKQKIIGMARDITEYAAMRMKQEESEAKYKLLFEKTTNGVLVWEPIYNSNNDMEDVKFVDVNPSIERLTGLTTYEVLGRTWYDIFQYKNRYLKEYERVLRTDEYYEFENYNPVLKQYFMTCIFKINNHRLGVVFENITERKTAEYEIAKLNVELEQRVTNRTLELQAAINELESFAYTVSHDLKSPLRAIDAYSRIMLEDYPQQLQGEMKDIVSNIKNTSSDMISMINKLLQYSTTTKQELYKERIDMKDMIHMSFHEMSLAYPQRKMNLDIETELPLMRADRVLMKLVIDNIISNAIKFTRTREIANIKVRHESLNCEVVFSIMDNGVGFDMIYSNKIFNIFERLHSSDEFEGSGIGLATVRKIIQIHGGRVWIEGNIEIGTTVFFSLPEAEE